MRLKSITIQRISTSKKLSFITVLLMTQILLHNIPVMIQGQFVDRNDTNMTNVIIEQTFINDEMTKNRTSSSSSSSSSLHRNKSLNTNNISNDNIPNIDSFAYQKILSASSMIEPKSPNPYPYPYPYPYPNSNSKNSTTIMIMKKRHMTLKQIIKTNTWWIRNKMGRKLFQTEMGRRLQIKLNESMNVAQMARLEKESLYHSMDKMKQQMLDDRTAFEKAKTKYDLDIMESESNYNKELQKSTALEESMNRMRKVKDDNIKYYKRKLEEAMQELNNKKMQIKTVRDQNHELTKDLRNAISELRKLELESSKQYCNFTHIKVDMEHYLNHMNRITKRKLYYASISTQRKIYKSSFVTKIMAIVMNARKKVSMKVNAIKKQMIPKLNTAKRSAKRSISRFYDSNVHPYLQRLCASIDHLYKTPVQFIKRNTILSFSKRDESKIVTTLKEFVSNIRLNVNAGVDVLFAKRMKFIARLWENE